MNRFALKITLALVTASILCQVHTFVDWKWKAFAETEVCLWIDKSFIKEQGEYAYVEVQYYIYELMNILRDSIWSFSFAMVARYISIKTYRVLAIYFLRNICQFLLYIYCRNSRFDLNLIVYIAMAIAIVLVFLPARKTPKLKAV